LQFASLHAWQFCEENGEAGKKYTEILKGWPVSRVTHFGIPLPSLFSIFSGVENVLLSFKYQVKTQDAELFNAKADRAGQT
jgi:hypothetical protein